MQEEHYTCNYSPHIDVLAAHPLAPGSCKRWMGVWQPAAGGQGRLAQQQIVSTILRETMEVARRKEGHQSVPQLQHHQTGSQPAVVHQV